MKIQMRATLESLIKRFKAASGKDKTAIFNEAARRLTESLFQEFVLRTRE